MKTLRIAIVAGMIVAGTWGAFALLTPVVVAADEPCDLVHGQIQACKAAHGHWSSRCCCCIVR